jgi:hypothetical protein
MRDAQRGKAPSRDATGRRPLAQWRVMGAKRPGRAYLAHGLFFNLCMRPHPPRQNNKGTVMQTGLRRFAYRAHSPHLCNATNETVRSKPFAPPGRRWSTPTASLSNTAPGFQDAQGLPHYHHGPTPPTGQAHSPRHSPENGQEQGVTCASLSSPCRLEKQAVRKWFTSTRYAGSRDPWQGEAGRPPLHPHIPLDYGHE